jgi:hypothetical protein
MEKKLDSYKTKHKILMDKVDNNLILIKEIAGEIRLNLFRFKSPLCDQEGLTKIKQILKMR